MNKMPPQKINQLNSLEYIVNHVFLPPKLPQNDKGETFENEVALLKQIRSSLLAFIGVSESHATRSSQVFPRTPVTVRVQICCTDLSKAVLTYVDVVSKA